MSDSPPSPQSNRPYGAGIQHEAYTLFEFQTIWCFSVALNLLSLLWIYYAELTFPPLWWDCSGYLILFLIVKGCHRTFLHRKSPYRAYCTLSARPFLLGAEYILLVRSVGASLCIVSYLCCLWKRPLIDSALRQIDNALHVNWSAIFYWSLKEPQASFLSPAYDSLVFQLFFFAIWFSYRDDKKRLVEIFWILFGCLVAAIVISAIFPAIGPAQNLGLLSSYSEHRDNINDVMSLRSTAPAGLIINKLGGVVVFPSFHVSAACIYMYAFRKYGLLSVIAVFLNLMMIISTPAYGDHYIIDMIMGASIAIAAILISRINLTTTPCTSFLKRNGPPLQSS